VLAEAVARDPHVGDGPARRVGDRDGGPDAGLREDRPNQGAPPRRRQSPVSALALSPVEEGVQVDGRALARAGHHREVGRSHSREGVPLRRAHGELQGLEAGEVLGSQAVGATLGRHLDLPFRPGHRSAAGPRRRSRHAEEGVEGGRLAPGDVLVEEAGGAVGEECAALLDEAPDLGGLAVGEGRRVRQDEDPLAPEPAPRDLRRRHEAEGEARGRRGRSPIRPGSREAALAFSSPRLG